MITWDDVMMLAFGQMGLDPAVFWRLSLKEWYEKQRGHFLKIENEEKMNWERTRWQTYILALPNAKKGALNSPRDLVKFPWEKDDEVQRLTAEDEDYLIRKMGRYFDPDRKGMEFHN